MKKTSNWARREKGLNVVALGAFILTALVFIYLLYYGQMLVGSSSAIR